MQVCGALTEKGEACRIKKNGAPKGWRCRFHAKAVDVSLLTALLEIGLKGPQPNYDEPVEVKGPCEAGVKERSLALERLRAELKPLLAQARTAQVDQRTVSTLEQKIRCVHASMAKAKLEMRAFQMKKKRLQNLW